jgi:hypothetical protein
MTMTWIDTAGGPLIGAAYPTGLSWGGTQASSTGDTRSDYDRACEVIDYVGVVPCASSHVLVFGDEPLQATVLSINDGIAVVRWVSCVSEGDAQKVLAEIPTALPQLEAPKLMSIEATRLVLFDSAYSLDAAPRLLEVALSPGLYEVSTEKFASPGVFEFLVHRMVRAAELHPT